MDPNYYDHEDEYLFYNNVDRITIQLVAQIRGWNNREPRIGNLCSEKVEKITNMQFNNNHACIKGDMNLFAMELLTSHQSDRYL